MSARTYRVGNGFGGMGGAALGFMMAAESLFGTDGRFELAGAIDFDQYACDAYKLFTGAEEACLDIEKVTVEDMRRVYGETAPDVMCGSPPCKGSSKLLGKDKAALPKYEQMNQLALKWTRLILSAWPAAPPRILIYENVPNITTRAKGMLAKVRAALRPASESPVRYALQDGYHNCGEVGGLAQHRKRWFMICRLERCETHPERCVPAFLYKPPKKRVRGCGEELEKLPLPGDPEAGSMHELPNVAAVQWFRLAFIPAGGDHRDLKHVLEGAPRRTKFRRHHVERWTDPSITIAGTGSNGPVGVADPRPGSFADIAPRPDATFHHVDRVTSWSEPVGTITHSPAPSSGAPSVADPRLGTFSIADPLIRSVLTVEHAYDHGYAVLHWGEPSATVASKSYVGCGAYSVADPRPPIGLNCTPRAGAYGVLPWSEAAKVITGSANVDNGAFAIADPRVPDAPPIAIIDRWDRPPFRLEVDAKGKVRRVPVPLVILAEDGTWHRPLTTRELLVLQGFPAKLDGKYVHMAGGTTAQRQAIGNAIPPPAMKAMAEQMILALVASDTGCFYLDKGGAGIWCRRPEVEAELRQRGIEIVNERRPWRVGGAVVCDDGAIVRAAPKKTRTKKLVPLRHAHRPAMENHVQ